MPTTVRSFSKINLGLAIGPVRPDGFHALTTLYQTLEAHDLVTVGSTSASATRISLTSNDARVPTDDRNTAFKAVQLALEALKVNAEVSIHIEKQLPIQGGMGAGSANAAGALLALDRELGANGLTALSSPERLRIAAEVGSDVPLFLIGGAVLGTGRGEVVFPLPDLPAMPCVVALPDIGVSTPQAFRDWDAKHGSNSLTESGPSSKLNTLSRSLASAFSEPHSSGVLALGQDLAEKLGASPGTLGGGRDPLLALVRTGIENDFEEVVFPKNPLFGEIKRILAASGTPELAAVYAALSGSGSALFGLYATEAAASAAEERLAKLGVKSMRTQTLSRDEYWRQVLVQ